MKYEGRHLITDEVIEVMNISLPLLHNGLTAISFYVRELEAACKVQSTHKVLAPLLGTFLSEILFNEKVTLTDNRLKSRLADQDVREHIRATFIPLIRARTVKTEKRRADGLGVQLRNWKPYQATLSERKPVERAKHTLFNLVPCDQSLEVAMTSFLDNCSDVTAFAKNAGPQALRIDYGNPHSVIGLLRSCLDFALNDTTKIDGVFKEVNTAFRFEGSQALFEKISAVNEFRNTYVAHSQKELRDAKLAEQNLKSWIVALSQTVKL